MPIGKYLDILAVCKDKINEDELTQQLAILSILADKSEEELLNLPLAEYTDLARGMTFLYAEDKNKTRVARSYTIGGFTLVPCTDLRGITAAQYIDFQTYAKEGDKFLVEMLSCFLIPQGKKYNQDYDIVEVQNAIRDNLSATDMFTLSAFFLKQFQRLITNSLHFLEKELNSLPQTEKVKQMKEQLKKVSLTSGRGYTM